MIQASIVSYLASNSPAKLAEIHWYLTVIKSHTISKRDLRSTIAELVHEGHPIVSGNSGYTLVTSDNDDEIMKELDKGIANLTSYALKILQRRRDLKLTRERLTARLIKETKLQKA